MPRPGKRKRTTTEVITFDKDSRAEYLTGRTYSMANSILSLTLLVGSGFHKRKVQRAKKAQEEAAKRAREERIKERKEFRDSRKEEIKKHVEAVKAALRPVSESDEETVGDSDASDESEDEFALKQNDLHREDEYIDEEKFTTVTVEPMDFGESSEDEDGKATEAKRKKVEETDDKKPKKSYPKEKKKKFTYLTKSERRVITRKIKATKIRRAMEGKEIRKAKGGIVKGKWKPKRK
ncbi:nucleolar protein 12-domain-containing protein [Tirmania nivea]|nr:nucleolar protein 12-domain-containing protein [Tirmania nivea]